MTTMETTAKIARDILLARGGGVDSQSPATCCVRTGWQADMAGVLFSRDKMTSAQEANEFIFTSSSVNCELTEFGAVSRVERERGGIGQLTTYSV